jgi:hypothetical protein
VGADLGQRRRDLESKSLAGAGDQGYLAVERKGAARAARRLRVDFTLLHGVKA